MPTRKIMLVRLILLFTILLSACGTATPTESTQPQGEQPTAAPTATTVPAKPVVMTVGWLGFPDSLNPAIATLSEAYAMFDLTYSTLVVESPTGEYVGDLAEDRSVSADGLTWTYKLRDGIKWHNGEPLTASDVAWNINEVINNPEGWAVVANYVNGFTEVTAPDDKTLVIKLNAPISNMDYRVSYLYVTYPKDFEQLKTAADLQNFLNFNLIGSGPFKISKVEEDQHIIILDANRDYYNGAAKIDQIIYQTFDNSDALVQALKVGDIDFTPEVPDSAYETVAGFENVKAVRLPGRSLTELILNTADPAVATNQTRNPALDDPQVRLAIETAINKQDIVDVVLQGNGAPGVSIIPPTLGGGFWFNSDIKPVAFNLEEANRILDEAGYAKGADGVRTKGDLRLDFRLQYPSDQATYPRTADMITGWLKEIGIKVTPEAVDPDSLVAITNPQGDYDLVIWGWGSDPDPDFMLSVMTTGQYVEGGWSDSGYHSPEYDQLYLDQQVTTDHNERQKIVWKMQAMIYNDRPYIVLTYSTQLHAYRMDRFTNFLESPLGLDSVFSYLQVEQVK